MELIGKTLTHSRYGKGTITKFYDKAKTFWVTYGTTEKGPYNYPEDLNSSLFIHDDDEEN